MVNSTITIAYIKKRLIILYYWYIRGYSNQEYINNVKSSNNIHRNCH